MKFQINENCFIDFYEVDTSEEGFEHLDESGLIIDLLQTDTSHQGQGLAAETLDAFVEKHGDRPLYLVCCPKDRTVDFDRLVNFYQDRGFSMADGASEMPYPLMER